MWKRVAAWLGVTSSCRAGALAGAMGVAGLAGIVAGTGGCASLLDGKPPIRFDKLTTHELYENKDLKFQVLSTIKLRPRDDVTIPVRVGDATIEVPQFGSNTLHRDHQGLFVARLPEGTTEADHAKIVARLYDDRQAYWKAAVEAGPSGIDGIDDRPHVVTNSSRTVEPHPLPALPEAQRARLSYEWTFDAEKVGKERNEVGWIVDVLVGFHGDRIFIHELILQRESLPTYHVLSGDYQTSGYDFEIAFRKHILDSLKILD